MRKYLCYRRMLFMIVLGVFAFKPSDSFSNAKNVEQEEHDFVNLLNQESLGQNKEAHEDSSQNLKVSKPQESTPKIHQEAMLNLLKGITVLKYMYAQALGSSSKQYAIGSTSLDLTLNPDNAREILDSMTMQVIRKLVEYENYLLKLAKEVDNSLLDQPVVIPSLEKTLKALWAEYAGRADREKIDSARSKNMMSAALMSIVFTGAVPLIGNMFFTIRSQDSAGLNFMSVMVVSLTSSIGALMGYCLSDNSIDIEAYKLEGLTSLSDQLELVTSAEELFNGALVGQKRRELLRKKSASGVTFLADY